MRAVISREYQSPEHLELADLPRPEPKPHEVLLKVRATGLGYADALMVAGLYQIKSPLPYIPGTEICGVVAQTGTEVTQLKPGDRVAAMGNQGLAEFTAVSARDCMLLDERISDEAAAGFLVNYCTALHGLARCGQLQSGETLLILGAAGGVGLAAIDIARMLGARVIAAASTEEKRRLCRSTGADEVLDYSRDNWRHDLKDLLAGAPLNMVYDPVGGGSSELAFRSLAPGGRFLVVGFAGGQIPKIPLNLPLLKQSAIIGVNWGGWRPCDPDAAASDLRSLLNWIAEGQLHPAAGKVYPLEESAGAMMDMLERRALGKVVIRVS